MTTWHLDPGAAALIVLLGTAYGAGVVSARRRGNSWPNRRIVLFFLLGLGSYAWISFGFLGAYSVQLRWAFATRIALLLFAVPWFLSIGRPFELAEAALGGRGLAALRRFAESRFMRIVGFAVFEPLFTLAFLMLFLTPISGILRLSPLAQVALGVLLPLFGLLMVVPLAEDTRSRTNLSIAFEFALAFTALVADALPGIMLRIFDTVFDGVPHLVGSLPAWFPNALNDQHMAGDVLWFLAEFADAPVIIILFTRWMRYDRKEAQAIDELSDEEMEALTQAHLNMRRE